MYSTTQTLAMERGRFAAAASRAWRVAARVIGGPAARPDPLVSLLPGGVARYLRKPWSAQELGRIDTQDRVLAIGTGPAAADLVTALDRQRHRGLIRLVSRTDLLPERLAALRSRGRIEVWVGTIEGAASYDDTLVVDVLPRGRTLNSSERYDWLVDCT